MNTRTIRLAIAAAAGMALAPTLSFGATHPTVHPVSLTQAPVVMRLSKDEFRIAFGLDAAHCAASSQGCTGTIRYRVDWKTEDGNHRSEIKQVAYTFVPQTGRSITVDRQYFDTAEGAHRTEVVKVSVAGITCSDGTGSALIRTASLASN